MQTALAFKDFAAQATWDEAGECSLATADKFPSFRLDVIEKNRLRSIATVRGVMAARMFCILDPDRRDVRTTDFNCFAAVDSVLTGENPQPHINWRAPKGKEVHFQDRSLVTPFGFQLHGSYFVPGECGMGWEACEGIMHEGIVLGTHRGEPVIFDKPGPLLPMIGTWRKMMKLYEDIVLHVRHFALPLVAARGDTLKKA